MFGAITYTHRSSLEPRDQHDLPRNLKEGRGFTPKTGQAAYCYCSKLTAPAPTGTHHCRPLPQLALEALNVIEEALPGDK